MSYSDKAALRGEPSYVWRSGQARRLRMIRQWVELEGRILDNGCGGGIYLAHFSTYSQQRFGLEIEMPRAIEALSRSNGVAQAAGEYLPFADGSFDFVFSNEVIEHVNDDQLAVAEMARVTRVGGRILIFCPNRWYPVETHGIYWRGEYKFGNKWLVNYLPDPMRDRLAPHVRAYSWGGLRRLFADLPVKLIHHSRIFGGYDNIENRFPTIGAWLKRTIYAMERTPVQLLGISHLLVLERI